MVDTFARIKDDLIKSDIDMLTKQSKLFISFALCISVTILSDLILNIPNLFGDCHFPCEVRRTAILELIISIVMDIE
ncbi:hypothetical protein Y1Q_0003221 [Alligator mississippiensis]|uniref:Uncharacterized protein n=1 Tax=Alligator mississippiensis TaxID=8496 RepID=A0A151MDW8_ALLMI|nr:hypothetical protein Y1Q_0003221 [Alligator mississippiensis]